MDRTHRAVSAIVFLTAFLIVFTATRGDAVPPEAAAAGIARQLEDTYAWVGLLRVEDAVDQLQRDVGAFIADVQAAYQAAHSVVAPRSAVSYSPTPNGGATGACGGATNGADQFIARESHGQADVWNTQGSGAWGCYQIMPATWASSCSDLGAHGSAPASAQAECASRLPLSAWGG